eukprot:m.98969 g.98969  ORF g.98969 m.98969 type:complete len:175 (-) comp13134_c0_seq2:2843-3367(-)
MLYCEHTRRINVTNDCPFPNHHLHCHIISPFPVTMEDITNVESRLLRHISREESNLKFLEEQLSDASDQLALQQQQLVADEQRACQLTKELQQLRMQTALNSTQVQALQQQHLELSCQRQTVAASVAQTQRSFKQKERLMNESRCAITAPTIVTLAVVLLVYRIGEAGVLICRL